MLKYPIFRFCREGTPNTPLEKTLFLSIQAFSLASAQSRSSHRSRVQELAEEELGVASNELLALLLEMTLARTILSYNLTGTTLSPEEDT